MYTEGSLVAMMQIKNRNNEPHIITAFLNFNYLNFRSNLTLNDSLLSYF